MKWLCWSSFFELYLHVCYTCNTSSIFISVRRIKKKYQMLWMKSQKVEREKSIWIFTPFYQTKRCCYLRFRGKGPSGAVLKPYNFSENSIIHKFSRKMIKLNKDHILDSNQFSAESLIKKNIDLNPYNNNTLHCLLRF